MKLIRKLTILIAGVLQATALWAIELPANGWSRMQIQAVQPAPQWCCFNQKGSAGVCDLQKNNFGFGSTDANRSVNDGYVWLYLKTEQGRISDLRTLGSQCQVKNNVEPLDLGTASSSESLALLQSLLNPGSKLSSDHIIAAIAVHADAKVDALLRLYADEQQPLARQKTALFWAGQLRGIAGESLAEEKLASSANAELRQHALFVIAQTDSAKRRSVLRQSGLTDRDEQVRGQAWFWLAQTELPEVELDIRNAAYQDQSEQVREQSIFALSQLPEPRGANALIALLNDAKASRANRKRALFWLAQSEQPQAQAYLQKVLD